MQILVLVKMHCAILFLNYQLWKCGNLEMFPILQLPTILQQEPITVLQANINVYLFLVQIY